MEALLAAQVAEQDELEGCAAGCRAKLLTRLLNDPGGCTARSAFWISAHNTEQDACGTRMVYLGGPARVWLDSIHRLDRMDAAHSLK